MKTITLCGSTKFKKQFEILNQQLTLEGNLVLSVGVFGHANNIKLSEEDKIKLDGIHYKKIDLSDAILVIDVDNYIGQSTKNEIIYAKSHDKTVKYLSNFPDLMTICDMATFNTSELARVDG